MEADIALGPLELRSQDGNPQARLLRITAAAPQPRTNTFDGGFVPT